MSNWAWKTGFTSSPISQWMSSLLQIYCFHLINIFGHARSSCVTRQCSACKTSPRSCKTALAPACVTDVGLRPMTLKKKKKMKKRKKNKMWVTRCEHYVCTKKLKTLPIKPPKKNIKELKNHTQKNNKIADAVVLAVLFLFFMFCVTYVTGQNLHVYSQQYLPYTSVNSSSENLGFKSNNISNWYLSLPPPPPPPPPFCLKCIAVVRRSFFLVSTAVERIKQDEQLLMCNWSDSRQGENALNTKLLQFLSFIKLCDSKSSVIRI